jgi:hypothetical protein
MIWHYWDGETWREVSDSELAGLSPDIVCGRLGGLGAMDPVIRIAVSDRSSVDVATAQHRRFRQYRGKR